MLVRGSVYRVYVCVGNIVWNSGCIVVGPYQLRISVCEQDYVTCAFYSFPAIPSYPKRVSTCKHTLTHTQTHTLVLPLLFRTTSVTIELLLSSCALRRVAIRMWVYFIKMQVFQSTVLMFRIWLKRSWKLGNSKRRREKGTERRRKERATCAKRSSWNCVNATTQSNNPPRFLVQ